jgi:CubicO group peptidase (beta-lactamase class C family)
MNALRTAAPRQSEPTFGLGEDILHAGLGGQVKPGFEPVREAFLANLQSGMDIGASVAVFLDGEPVVDLWGGYFDATYTRPFGRRTIVNTFSSTKSMTALAALVLADRGEIDLEAPVAKYWPQFAAGGKAGVLVRHLLGHSSGLAGWTDFMTLADFYDVETAADRLARQEPWWEPGTASGYHGFTMGHLVDGVVRRVTGLSLGAFFAQEVAGPTGADFLIGTPEERDADVSLLIQGYPIQPMGGEFFKRALLNPVATPRDAWSIPWRRAELGAVNGHGSGHGIAAAQAILANGGLAGGRKLLSDAGRERVLQVQSSGLDLVLGAPLTWGLGYCLNSPVTPDWRAPAGFGRCVAHWGGGGGSMSYVDLDARLSFGFAPNRWITGPHEQDRSMRLLRATYACLADLAR